MKFPAHLDAATRRRIRVELRGIGQLIRLVRDHPKPVKAPAQLKILNTDSAEPVAHPSVPAQYPELLPGKKRPAPN